MTTAYPERRSPVRPGNPSPAGLHHILLHSSSNALHLLEQSKDCMKILSMEGRLEFMNCSGQKAMQIDNFTKFQGKIWWEFWPEKTRHLVRTAFNRAAGGSQVSFEADCPTAMGELRHWMVELLAMKAPTGIPVAVLCKSRDLGSLA